MTTAALDLQSNNASTLRYVTDSYLNILVDPNVQDPSTLEAKTNTSDQVAPPSSSYRRIVLPIHQKAEVAASIALAGYARVSHRTGMTEILQHRDSGDYFERGCGYIVHWIENDINWPGQHPEPAVDAKTWNDKFWNVENLLGDIGMQNFEAIESDQGVGAICSVEGAAMPSGYRTATACVAVFAILLYLRM
jgi:hypothetical protein